MFPVNIAVLVLTVGLIGISNGLPVSQDHRFAVYTPYWHQNLRSQTPLDSLDPRQRLDCITLPCGSDLGLSPEIPHSRNDLPPFRTTKRSKNLYKTGWTMGGMPFSVLYMNPKPQISVRSPAAEPLRALPQTYENNEFLLREPPSVAEAHFTDYAPGVQAEALVSPGPTLKPTRRQYSIIPQLFVSYGWGPLGK